MQLPTPEDLRFKSSEWLLSLQQQLAESSRAWFIGLAAAAALALPLYFVLAGSLSRSFIGRYQPPAVNRPVSNAAPLQVLKTGVLDTGSGGVFSAYAQVRNPNAEFSARQIIYHFAGSGEAETYLLAGESKFLVLPAFSAAARPSSIELVIQSVKWTRTAGLPVGLQVLQKATGATAEGNFFVEALVKNQEAWRIRKVDVQVLVFDRANRELLAVNATQFTDLLPFESRYFRVLWPERPKGEFGQIEIIPSVNPFQPGAAIDLEGDLPAR